MNILQTCDDFNLFGAWFRDTGTWAAWRAFLCALFALPMTANELMIYQACTSRQAPPSSRVVESWLVCGRRAGKSFVLALVAVFLACFFDWRPFLSPGERGVIVIIAADRRQARVIVGYIRALLAPPMLSDLVAKDGAEEIELTNGITIEVATCSYRTIRGRTIIAALCDEIAFWLSEGSANPDYEVLDAIRPAMATVPGAMLMCASSPYARRGAMWDAFQKYHGKNNSAVLVWRAATRIMNPTVPQSVIDEAMERDLASASAEYLAEFRSDVERLFTREAIVACVKPGLLERKPERRHRYVGFVDPSGGAADSFTLAIGHREGDNTAILDAVRERKPPFSPEAVVDEFAELLRSYRIVRVVGDRYAGEWPREQFRKRGVNYQPSDKTKSDLFRDLLPLVNSGAVDLLDNDRLVSQLSQLERRTARGGRDSIDHAPGGHDDLANAAAGALVNVPATDRPYVPQITHEGIGGYRPFAGLYQPQRR